MAAAKAALPCTTACSPNTMTLPGAETMKAGAIGEEALRDMLGRRDFVPLTVWEEDETELLSEEWSRESGSVPLPFTRERSGSPFCVSKWATGRRWF